MTQKAAGALDPAHGAVRDFTFKGFLTNTRRANAWSAINPAYPHPYAGTYGPIRKRFDRWRFPTKRPRKPPPFAWVPFGGGGPRICASGWAFPHICRPKTLARHFLQKILEVSLPPPGYSSELADVAHPKAAGTDCGWWDSKPV